MIAMAMINKPKLLIADEPTTALDVTVQKQVLDLINNLQKKHQMTVLFITHDFGVVEDIADQVLVMYRGKIVEQGVAKSIIKNPKHPYTKALLKCIPSIHSKKTLQPIDYLKLEREMAKL
jgi:peptide/nickel transport system ATP-binding protein